MQPQRHILPIIVIAQFCCTSLWFASNGVLGELISTYRLPSNALGVMTSSIQFGFITGTLIFATLTIVDRFSPSKVFLVCAILGSVFNLGLIWDANELWSVLSLRFLTGFFLAGIYPVGMKIAADYFEKGLGKSLGFLVGALVLGTSFPHFIKGFWTELPWRGTIISTSALALAGGILLWLLVPNGPFRKKSTAFRLSAFLEVFRKKDFRQAAFGYFGHMWELYAFWAFTPIALTVYNSLQRASLNVPIWSFSIIAVGSIGCVVAGYLSVQFSEKRIAMIALCISGMCCLLSPFVFKLPPVLFILFFLIWGIAVIADSPLFSTLVAQRAPSEVKGTALTIVNCIGFAITIVSIQLLTLLSESISTTILLVVLALGPIAGLLALRTRDQS